MKEKIGGLIRLQDCDNRIKEIVIRKKEGPIRIQRLEYEFNTNIIEFQKENERLDSLKKERRALEQQIQDLESKQGKSRIKLSSIKSHKEYSLVLKEIERNVIFRALDQTDGNRTHAAEILGISVRTLRNKLNEYRKKMEIQ